ncbi:hypothetical protein K493DRAFT_409834 [Basidiobolus meristosporus CBS 931.73]|uniref:Uncharacterized protein n=1 Tax=Basidiobolus meristosporus CBS 931.73 TaxID=1314790 RepID=A0A1Y1XYH9_9FUNG|nr:hypothetical protein K493DRAFT_409834 [Basidiobolus meristosporus CBS 931.73]|eukprot:ORX90536.1 hypothetical protein K493DRAFT_409834 [Basidiobolus meristosporus CBS 931.73]
MGNLDLLGSNERESALIGNFSEGWATLIDYFVHIPKEKTEEAKEAARHMYKAFAAELINYYEKQLSKELADINR